MCEMSTPLGLPVVPEVYMSTAVLVTATGVGAAGALAPLALSSSIRWMLMPAALSFSAASADLYTHGLVGRLSGTGWQQDASKKGGSHRRAEGYGVRAHGSVMVITSLRSVSWLAILARILSSLESATCVCSHRRAIHHRPH